MQWRKHGLEGEVGRGGIWRVHASQAFVAAILFRNGGQINRPYRGMLDKTKMPWGCCP